MNEGNESEVSKRRWQIFGIVLLMGAVLSVLSIGQLWYPKTAAPDLIVRIAKTGQFLGTTLLCKGMGLSSLEYSRSVDSAYRVFEKNRNRRITTWIGFILTFIAMLFRFFYSLV